jgi:hypothetical protein
MKRLHTINNKYGKGFILSSYFILGSTMNFVGGHYILIVRIPRPPPNNPSNFFYSCADMLLLWAANIYTTWRLRDTQ